MGDWCPSGLFYFALVFQASTSLGTSRQITGSFPPMQSSVIQRAFGFGAFSPLPRIFGEGFTPQKGQGLRLSATACACDLCIFRSGREAYSVQNPRKTNVRDMAKFALGRLVVTGKAVLMY